MFANSCLEIALLAVPKIEVNEKILDSGDLYDYLFSVEEVNKRVLNGVPFRDAYKEVGLEIEAGNFNPDKSVHHTHEGSIGNLCTSEIKSKMENNFSKINISEIENKLKNLLQ